MKKIINHLLFGILLIAALQSCQDILPEPEASFRIEKDTIINNLKTRVEITTADTIHPIYFVYEGSAMFNTVWPGDRFKKTVTVNYSPTEKNKKITYFVNQDYDTRQDSVILSYIMRRDTAWAQAAILHQGIALSYGTKEMEYTFKSKGDLTVTWISRNANFNEANEAILQKKIRVR